MELCKEYKSMNCNEKSNKICESFDLEYQENLPQYLDDVEKVIKCYVSNVITDYECSGSVFKIFGKTIISITYLNSSFLPMSNIFEEEFTKSFDIDSSDYFFFADVNINTKYSNFRLINQRRIDIHTAVCVQIDTYNRTASKALSNCKNAFVKESSMNVLSTKSAGICSAEFDETFSIPNNNSQIKNIVNSFYTCFIEDKKIIKDKMLVKLRVEASVLFNNEGDAIENCSHIFSISKIIDIDETNENDNAFVSATISNLYIKTKADSNNLLNEIEIVGKATFKYQIFSVIQREYITDSYIPHFKTHLITEKSAIRREPVFYFDDKSVELTFDNDKSIVEILDLKSEILSCKVEKSVMIIQFGLNFLYYDDTSQLCSFEKVQEYKLTLSSDELEGCGCANMSSYDFVIKNTDKIALRINFEYSAFLYRTQVIEYLTDIDAEYDEQNTQLPQMTLYFADKNESVWDIAKSFSTDSKLIMEENGLSSELIQDKRIILIPGM
ncbi:MAG: SPOCS domain-containing protein [Eubacterium sp.]